MANVSEWVKQSTSTIGRGNISLGAAIVGHVAFGDVCTDGEQMYYAIVDGYNRELGIGTYVSATNSLVRSTLFKTLEYSSGVPVYNESPVDAIYLSGNGIVYSVVTEDYFQAVSGLDAFLISLSSLATNGLVIRSGESGLTRQIQPTSGQTTVTNGSGVNGDPTIGLATVVTAGTNTKLTYDIYGRITSGTTLVSGDIPTLDFGTKISGKPTTLAGYGITNGVKTDGTNTVGNYTCTFQGIVDVENTLKCNNFTFRGSTAGTASAGAATLPGNPVGFAIITVGSTEYKIPYYGL